MPHTVPTTPSEFDHTRIIERPDGFYWQDKAGGREYGPFATLVEAVADMEGLGADDGGDDASGLREAEDVLDVPDWVDPDTGELADDERTRTDDH